MSWFLAVWLPLQLGEFFIAHIFFKDFLGIKERKKLLWVFCVVVFVSALNLLGLLNEVFAIKVPLTVLLYLALAFMFSGGLKIKLLAACLYSAFLFIADVVVFYSARFCQGGLK